MAEELEEVMNVIGDAEDGIEAESEDNVNDNDNAEENKEVENAVADAKQNVNAMSDVASTFKEFLSSSSETLKSFGLFVTKNIAIGTIFYGVTVTLTKMTTSSDTDSSQQESNTKMLEVVQAITQLIQSETDLCTAIKDWLTEHQDDTITLDGIDIKLEAIFEEKLQPISDAVDNAYSIATTLMTKVDENISWNIPTADDISNLLVASDAFLEAFGELKTFADDNVANVSALQSLLDILTQSALDQISVQLDAIKKMPLY